MLFQCAPIPQSVSEIFLLNVTFILFRMILRHDSYVLLFLFPKNRHIPGDDFSALSRPCSKNPRVIAHIGCPPSSRRLDLFSSHGQTNERPRVWTSSQPRPHS